MQTPNYPQSAYRTPKRRPSLRRRIPLLMALFGSLCAVLAVVALAGYYFLRPVEAAARPLVLIHAPLSGDQIEVGQAVTIHATARDDNNITRMELWVDDALVQTETSRLPGGISPFPIVTNWEPTVAGMHTLTVRAFNSQGTRAHSSVNVEAVELPDRDNDGVADERDACPDEASPTRDGCPLSDDRDNDGLPDSEDACPDEAGWADIDGCPTPGDSDGDGILDEEDACPEERGLSDVEGCPDRDGDSVPDHLDADPDEPGPVDSGGAPEPEGGPGGAGPGPGEGAGGEPGVPDSDGDGATDDVDPCPHEYGEPEDDYCQPPESEPPPGPIFEVPGIFLFHFEIPVNIEIEAYEFTVNDDFDNVWCYVQVADAYTERYEFEPEGERQWNVRDVLAGANSVHMAAIWGEPLSIDINCGADNIYTFVEEDDDGGIPEGGGWASVFDLGTYSAEHGSMEWDGRELIASGMGPDGETFSARYRICSPTCDETALAPPILDPPGGDIIRWHWDGNEEWIDGFVMFVNGTMYDAHEQIAPSRRSLDISDFDPECGEVFEFQIFAFGGDTADGTYRQSPHSNSQYRRGGTCPRTVLVTFLSMDPFALGSRQGPISGTFWANDVSLIAEFRDGPPSFDATDEIEHYIEPGHFFNIADLFSEIESYASGHPFSTWNYAPSVNYVEVELGPYEDLTFGANISKEGGGSAFEGDAFIHAGEIVPGEYVVYDNGINMTVLVDVLVGPEAGGADHLPDLTITDITAHPDSGWLQIHLFNNASDLIDQSIEVNLVNMSTNEQIDFITAYNVTIPSGGDFILEHPVDTEPYNLRAIVDPDNEIDETNDGNNVFETPARLRVEFTQLRWGRAVCESFLKQSGEFRFRMWVGHRSPDGDITWIRETTHPWAGTVDVDWSDSWPDDDDPSSWPPGWVLDGDSSIQFEFDIPADHNLVIKADGYEVDPGGVSSDDYAGSVFVEYLPEMDYGNRPNAYLNESTGYHDCPDAPPAGWDEFNFYIWWRITRIH
jgi:hypothetical protein